MRTLPLLLLLGSSAAWAYPITVRVQATVTFVDDPPNALGGAVQRGDTMVMYYVFESTGSDSHGAFNIGNYWHASAGYGMLVQVGGLELQSDPNGTDFLIEIADNEGNPPADRFFLQSFTNVVGSGVVAGEVQEMTWQLDDATGTALSSPALSLDAPELTDWGPSPGVTLSGFGAGPAAGLPWRVRARATAAFALQGDTDADGIDDPSDNCPLDANPLQEDWDIDLVGDICDTPQLTVGGVCPTRVRLTIDGMDPGDRWVLMGAPGTGSHTIPRGPCGGLVTGLARGARVVERDVASPLGDWFKVANVPPPVCGMVWLQAIDMASCTASQPVPL